MSSNEDGVKMVRYAAAQIEALCPEVINAARILAARPRSKVAQENMDVFRDAWETHVRVLTEAVDDITTIDDFLAVSGEYFTFNYFSFYLPFINFNSFFFYTPFLFYNFRKSHIGRREQMCSGSSGRRWRYFRQNCGSYQRPKCQGRKRRLI